MDCAILPAASGHRLWARFLLAAALSTAGCGRSHDVEAAKKAGETPVLESPPQTTARDAAEQVNETDEKQSVPVDEDDLWVPMTGEESVVADKIELLTDGAAVRPAPAEVEPAETATVRRVE